MAKRGNSNLHKARKAQNDEFYTQLPDIERELRHYSGEFKNKTVLCNCDDPVESNFVEYFSLKFEELGLKKLLATHYIEAATRRGRKPYMLEYTGDKDGNRVPDPEEFIFKMIGDGDFRSEECIELLKQADIVVTNPPFSLFREYLAQLIEYDKKFLIIGNINAITYKETFKLIKEGKMHVSPYHFNKTLNFEIPDSYENFSYINADGNKVAAVPAICWFTNLDSPARHEDLKLYKKYNKQEYPKYDNYKAIEVSKVANIPMDYLGVMGVPITFLGKHNPDQFEIVGLANDKRDVDPIFIKGTSTYLDDRHKSFVGMVLKGRAPYARILIRNKKVED